MQIMKYKMIIRLIFVNKHICFFGTVCKISIEAVTRMNRAVAQSERVNCMHSAGSL